MTTPPQCMPGEYKDEDTVTAYRAYYRHKRDVGIVTYGRGRETPDWLN